MLIIVGCIYFVLLQSSLNLYSPNGLWNQEPFIYFYKNIFIDPITTWIHFKVPRCTLTARVIIYSRKQSLLSGRLETLYLLPDHESNFYLCLLIILIFSLVKCPRICPFFGLVISFSHWFLHIFKQDIFQDCASLEIW